MIRDERALDVRHLLRELLERQTLLWSRSIELRHRWPPFVGRRESPPACGQNASRIMHGAAAEVAGVAGTSRGDRTRRTSPRAHARVPEQTGPSDSTSTIAAAASQGPVSRPRSRPRIGSLCRSPHNPDRYGRRTRDRPERQGPRQTSAASRTRRPLEAPADYIAGHTTYAGAAQKVLEHIFGRHPGVSVTLSSATAPGVVETYTTFKAIADDVVDARVWGGIHWRTSSVRGRTVGEEIGRYAVRHYLKPRGDDDARDWH